MGAGTVTRECAGPAAGDEPIFSAPAPYKPMPWRWTEAIAYRRPRHGVRGSLRALGGRVCGTCLPLARPAAPTNRAEETTGERDDHHNVRVGVDV